MKTPFKRITVCFFVVALGLHAQDGAVDYTFGNAGAVDLDFNLAPDFIYAAADDQDNKLVVGGVSFSTDMETAYLSLARLLDDGSLDVSFGDNGKVLTLPTTDDELSPKAFIDIKVLNNGGVLALGYIGDNIMGDIILAKYLENGSLDPDFADNGLLEFSVAGDSPHSLFLLPDNKYLIAGRTFVNGANRSMLIKVLEDGSFDTTFGNNGITINTTLDPNFIITDVIMQDDGKIVKAGRLHVSGVRYVYIARFLENGDLDTSFGSSQNGIFTGFPSNVSTTVAINQCCGNKLIVALGESDFKAETETTHLFRLHEDGSIDDTFGGGDLLFAGDFFPKKVIVQHNQRILVSGSISNFYMQPSLTTRRFYHNGSPDPSFMTIQLNIEGNKAYLLQSGKILVIGNDLPLIEENDMLIRRFHNNPLSTPDFYRPELVIYPNPSNGLFFIENSQDVAAYTYSITDNLGRIIKQGSSAEALFSIDLSGHAPGIYYFTTNFNTFRLLKK